MFDSHANFFYDEPMEHGGTRRIKISGQIGTEVEVREEGEVIQLHDKPADKSKEKEAEKGININLAGFASLKDKLPGIGRTSARIFIKNRPAGGYKDFEEFQSLNEKEVKVNYEELKESISFE
jgi:DNA uptake protein ComE-like DNA-binding protein